SGSIGEEATRFRLAETMGLRRDPEELVREAKDALESAQGRMLDCASRSRNRVRALAGATDLASVGAGLRALHAQQIAGSNGEVIPAYERLVHEATYLARRHGLLPADLSMPGE